MRLPGELLILAATGLGPVKPALQIPRVRILLRRRKPAVSPAMQWIAGAVSLHFRKAMTLVSTFQLQHSEPFNA